MTRLIGKTVGKALGGNRLPEDKARVEMAFGRLHTQLCLAGLKRAEAQGALSALPLVRGEEFLYGRSRWALAQLEVRLKDRLEEMRPPQVALQIDPGTRLVTNWKLLGGQRGNP